MTRTPMHRRTQPRRRPRLTPIAEGLDRRVLFAVAPLDPLTVPKFVNQLFIPPLAQPDTPGGNTFTVNISQFQEDLLGMKDANGNPLMTTVWGYNGTYPGPTFVAQQGTPIQVKWVNDLVDAQGHPLPHLLPVDPTLVPSDEYATMQTSGVPIVTHLHGGHTASPFDGLPDQWYTPLGAHGPDATAAVNNYVVDTYNNDQEPGTLWYHDHADGITRLNVYAGLAGFYLLKGPSDTSLNLPSGPYEAGLAIQDRMFDANGQLVFPSDPLPGTTAPFPSEHPEMFGNVMLVNGKAWPVMDVEPRKYRFHLLDGSDSRTYNLSLSNGQTFTQIGADDGLLNAPVKAGSLLLAPGEREDVVIDFSKYAGKTIILTNNAKAPYPAGTAADPQTVGQIMAFRVDLPLAGTDTSTVPSVLRATPFHVPGPVVSTRQLELFETVDQYNRLMQLIGPVSVGGLHFSAPITEFPVQGTTEDWQVYNTTADMHPIHLHGVSFEIISRQNFKATQDPVTGALSNIKLTGKASGPNANELGPKDTAEMFPGTVTTIRAHFDLLGKYVYHCHILSHEEHDMMRPYEVVAPPKASAPAVVTQVTPQTVTTTATTATITPDSSRPTVSALLFGPDTTSTNLFSDKPVTASSLLDQTAAA